MVRVLSSLFRNKGWKNIESPLDDSCSKQDMTNSIIGMFFKLNW